MTRRYNSLSAFRFVAIAQVVCGLSVGPILGGDLDGDGLSDAVDPETLVTGPSTLPAGEYHFRDMTDVLDPQLDESTLEVGPVRRKADGEIISGPGVYRPGLRTITWLVGELGSGGGALHGRPQFQRGPDGRRLRRHHGPPVPLHRRIPHGTGWKASAGKLLGLRAAPGAAPLPGAVHTLGLAFTGPDRVAPGRLSGALSVRFLLKDCTCLWGEGFVTLTLSRGVDRI